MKRANQSLKNAIKESSIAWFLKRYDLYHAILTVLQDSPKKNKNLDYIFGFFFSMIPCALFHYNKSELYNTTSVIIFILYIFF